MTTYDTNTRADLNTRGRRPFRNARGGSAVRMFRRLLDRLPVLFTPPPGRSCRGHLPRRSAARPAPPCHRQPAACVNRESPCRSARPEKKRQMRRMFCRGSSRHAQFPGHIGQLHRAALVGGSLDVAAMTKRPGVLVSAPIRFGGDALDKVILSGLSGEIREGKHSLRGSIGQVRPRGDARHRAPDEFVAHARHRGDAPRTQQLAQRADLHGLRSWRQRVRS